MARTIKTGTVVSTKCSKTITVLVEFRKKHPLYKKTVRVHRKFMAHDEHEQAKLGDVVRIEESRPLSARKRWILMNITTHSQQTTDAAKSKAGES